MHTKREIAKMTGYSGSSVNEYLKEEFNPVNGCYGVTLRSQTELFRDNIIGMRADGLTY